MLPANEKSDSAQHSSLSEAARKGFPCGIKAFGNLGSDLHPTFAQVLNSAVSSISKKKHTLLCGLCCTSLLPVQPHPGKFPPDDFRGKSPAASTPVPLQLWGWRGDCLLHVCLSPALEDGDCGSSTYPGSLTLWTHKLLLKGMGEGHS